LTCGRSVTWLPSLHACAALPACTDLRVPPHIRRSAALRWRPRESSCAYHPPGTRVAIQLTSCAGPCRKGSRFMLALDYLAYARECSRCMKYTSAHLLANGRPAQAHASQGDRCFMHLENHMSSLGIVPHQNMGSSANACSRSPAQSCRLQCQKMGSWTLRVVAAGIRGLYSTFSGWQ
jgi:hypothetical protein